MPPRSLDLLDLPTLYRLRSEAVSLDTARFLTRGNPLGAVGLASYLNPSRNIYSAISQEKDTPLLGGVSSANSDPFAHLTYLAPSTNLTHPKLLELIDHLAAVAGEWGAFHLLADVDEDSPAFAPLRMAGFSVYAWQSVWDLSSLNLSAGELAWAPATDLQHASLQALYHQIVPPLIQPVEPPPQRASGLVCLDNGRCYVRVAYGVYGIVLTPLIHPEVPGVAGRLASLLAQLPDRMGRRVYICVRSYQAWLESAIEELGGRATSKQAVMVKHLAGLVKDEQSIRAARPAGVSVQPSRAERHAQRLMNFSKKNR